MHGLFLTSCNRTQTILSSRNSSKVKFSVRTIRTSNAVIEVIGDETDPELVDEAAHIREYITENIIDDVPFSKIIKNADDVLGYDIHADSFVYVIEELLRKEPNILVSSYYYGRLDDVGLYNKDLPHVTLAKDYITRYENALFEAIEYVESDVEENKLSDTNSNPSEEDKSSNTSSDGYVRLPVEAPDNVSTHSSTSSSGSSGSDTSLYDDDGNNTAIIIYTIATFIAITAIAWYVKKYHPNTMETSNDIVEESGIHSVYEPMALQNVMIAIGYCLVPTIMFYYTYRYYYLYRLKFKTYINNYYGKH